MAHLAAGFGALPVGCQQAALVLVTLANRSVSTASNTDWPCAIGATSQRACPLVRGCKPVVRDGVSRAPGLRTGGCISVGDSTQPASDMLQMFLRSGCMLCSLCMPRRCAGCMLQACSMFSKHGLPHQMQVWQTARRQASTNGSGVRSAGQSDTGGGVLLVGASTIRAAQPAAASAYPAGGGGSGGCGDPRLQPWCCTTSSPSGWCRPPATS